MVWELHLPACQSLKDKRTIVKSLKDRMHNRFNVSVAETGHQDLWQRAELTAAVVSTDRRRAVSAGAAVEGAEFADKPGAAFPSGPRHRARAAHRSRVEGAEGDGRLSNGGLVLAAKPAGPTSHDVVDIVRRALGEQRVGHLGTLDPFAKGLLVLVVGRATRLAPFAAEWPKTYEGVIRLGVTTDTDDLTGAVVATAPWTAITPAQLADVIGSFRGAYEQRPPAYSAVKIEGERAYRRARRGEVVTPEPRPVEIRELEIVEAAVPDLRFRATVSAGTD